MIKLSEKDQNIIASKSFTHVDDISATQVINTRHVEELLIQKGAENKDEIKSAIAEFNFVLSSIADFVTTDNESKSTALYRLNRIIEGNLINAKEGLAQHDKQVACNALLDFSVYMRYQDRALANPVYNDLAEYINKIREQ